MRRLALRGGRVPGPWLPGPRGPNYATIRNATRDQWRANHYLGNLQLHHTFLPTSQQWPPPPRGVRWEYPGRTLNYARVHGERGRPQLAIASVIGLDRDPNVVRRLDGHGRQSRTKRAATRKRAAKKRGSGRKRKTVRRKSGSGRRRAPTRRRAVRGRGWNDPKPVPRALPAPAPVIVAPPPAKPVAAKKKGMSAAKKAALAVLGTAAAYLGYKNRKLPQEVSSAYNHQRLWLPEQSRAKTSWDVAKAIPSMIRLR